MIEILKPGLLSTFQDGGRHGFQQFGVPVCGAMDWFSLAAANILVGNEWDDAALEITLLGPVIRFEQDAVFSLAGAGFSARLNDIPIPINQAQLAHAGDLLDCGTAQSGFRAYLAVAGGFDLPPVMGSKSTCLKAGFGGFNGRALQAGDKIGLCAPQLWIRNLPNRHITVDFAADAPVHVVLGPQNDVFSPSGISAFFSQNYQFSSSCDRMGCRLEGPEISLKPGKTPNIISDGVAMGSIQVPNGQPILMMADRQTTGGYVKLGTVASADLPIVGQKKPGDFISFVPVTVQEAQLLRHQKRRQLKNWQWELDREDRW